MIRYNFFCERWTDNKQSAARIVRPAPRTISETRLADSISIPLATLTIVDLVQSRLHCGEQCTDGVGGVSNTSDESPVFRKYRLSLKRYDLRRVYIRRTACQ
jgi:hypothetical protein